MKMDDPKKLKPESLMMSFGYRPELSEGSVKVPIFLTSTFSFKTAEEGKQFFEIAYGKRKMNPDEQLGLIYSRINNPNIEILEDRLAVWDGAEAAASFESGMAAISTVLFEFLRPGDLVLHSNPIYGGTHHFIRHVLPQFGIDSASFMAGTSEEELRKIIQGREEDVKVIYLETPANPTNALFDLEAISAFAKSLPGEPITVVDNTYLGPMWQKPLRHGIDLCVYSATKFLGGHSDLIAGSVTGSAELLGRVKVMRTFLGNMASPHTGWMLIRSLETLKVRTDRQEASAKKIAEWLQRHPKIERVYSLSLLEKGTRDWAIFQKQCTGSGAMISFDVVRGEKAAFRFLNALQLIQLAVSLGGTESLCEHPATMTHCDIPEEERNLIGVSDKLVRMSVGVEDPDDLIADLDQALRAV